MTAIDAVRASVETWNNADRQGFLACYTEDCKITTPTLRGTGHDGVAAFWASTLGTMPDARVDVALLIADGQVVAEEATTRGTNTGPSSGPDGTEIPPTGRAVTIPFTAVHTVRDGRIASSRFYWDTMSILGQLGLLPGS
jgi:steroid delta-isomerase-like uncharacterized protein